jgi:hypothetical protein
MLHVKDSTVDVDIWNRNSSGRAEDLAPTTPKLGLAISGVTTYNFNLPLITYHSYHYSLLCTCKQLQTSKYLQEHSFQSLYQNPYLKLLTFDLHILQDDRNPTQSPQHLF